VPAAETWAGYDPLVQWQDAENTGLGEIDTPGDYELHSENNLNDTVYNLAARFATSGLGYLYEDSQGRIGYADSTHRAQYLATRWLCGFRRQRCNWPSAYQFLNELEM
jgi:hypothetical protein